MNFLEEINSLLKDDAGGGFSDFRYVNMGGKALYVEGHRGIIKFEDKEIIFRLKKKELKIAGEDLKVKYFDDSTAIVNGDIIQVMTI